MTSDDNAFRIVGEIAGGLIAFVIFLGVYVAAVGSVGWVIGIALGWIPAGIAAWIGYVIGRYLWWLLALGLIALMMIVLRS